MKAPQQRVQRASARAMSSAGRARIRRARDGCFRALAWFGAFACLTAIATAAPDGQKPPWQRIGDVMNFELPIPGSTEYDEDRGLVVTMPSGRQYTSSVSGVQATITLPNGQQFTEMTADQGFGRVFINQDETIVAAVLSGSTQSGDLYLYAAGADGQFRQIPDAHEQIRSALQKAGAPFQPDVLRLVTVGERRLTLFSLIYEDKSIGTEGWLFTVEVTPDGQVALVGHP